MWIMRNSCEIYLHIKEAHEESSPKNEVIDAASGNVTWTIFGFTKWHNFVAFFRNECESCDKQFYSTESLRRHMKIHSERTFKCELCGIRFVSSEFLRTHLIKHKEEWSYDCGLCSKIFKHSSSVSGHRRLHKINGYYHCGCCNDRFKDYTQLKNHFVNTKHSFYSEEN